MSGFIRYEIKNDVEYASVYHAKRKDGKKINEVEWLGRVVDKENGIYQNKIKGIFRYKLEAGVCEYISVVKEKLLLDFGDSYFLNEILRKIGFLEVIERVFAEKTELVQSLMFYKTLHGGSSCYAQTWWEGSYARILFPNATLASQRNSEILRYMGDESLQRAFFREYLKYISSYCSGGVLIDSTGLPNDTNFPLTAVNNHNGVISNEARLILVLDKVSGYPIYFRYAAGNIVDVSTLRTTIAEVRTYGLDIQYAIIDAGYFSEKNIKALQSSSISFVMRMTSNLKLYKTLITEHKTNLEDAKYLIKYRGRFVYIKCVDINLYGKTGYAYVCLDMDRKHEEIKKYMDYALDDKKITFDEMNTALQSKGLFILVSSEKINTTEILPLYYTRQAIEQVFDISKNNADLLPLRIHGIENFRGHLLLSFIVSAIYIFVTKMLAGSDVCAVGAYQILRNLKCKVFDDKIIVQEANRKMNDIAKLLKLDMPTFLMW